ncbi:MAG: SRPBCC family protein [Burkholderiales bacterium]
MKRLIALTVLLFFPIVLWAAAKTLKVTETAEIAAPPDAVWAKVKDFNGLHTWHPAVKKAEIVEGENNKKGAVRVLTLGDGGTIKEKLHTHNDKGKSFKYSIIEGVLPVSDYVSTVKVKPGNGGGSLVQWQGKFKRKDTGDKPAEGQDDKTAVDTITSVYKAGLESEEDCRKEVIHRANSHSSFVPG